MTPIVPIDAPNFRTEAQREAHNDAILRQVAAEILAAQPKRKRETQAERAAAWSRTPSGKREQRGVPIAGRGGLDIRRDPLVELLARERSRITGKLARKAYDAIEEGRIAR
jgi:hypothetical protein